jgi:sulfite oxidase
LIRSVRNHGGIPDIQEDAFELEIGGLVSKSVKLSLKDLKDPAKFLYVKLHSVSADGILLSHTVKPKLPSLCSAAEQCELTLAYHFLKLTVILQRRLEQIAQYPGDGDELINAPWGEYFLPTPASKVLPLFCNQAKEQCEPTCTSFLENA